MPLKVIDKLLLPVYTELIIVDHAGDRRPLEVEQSQLRLLRLGPVLAPAQHSTDDGRVVSALDENVMIFAVFAEVAAVFLTDAIILSPNLTLLLQQLRAFSVRLFQLVPVFILLDSAEPA